MRLDGIKPTEPRWVPGIGAPVVIRISRRARRVGLRVDAVARNVELVLPRGIPARDGLRFLAAKREWIVTRLNALPQPVPFAEGAVVPVLGVQHHIRRGSAPSLQLVRIADGEIRVSGNPAYLAHRVRDYLVAIARAELAPRARRLAAQVGREVERVSVRDTKSRWGSCSGRGNLSFSWRLILAPEPVLDYVVAHEVAHLIEMNHGPLFWRLVESLAPGHSGARSWLKRHRDRLLSYG